MVNPQVYTGKDASFQFASSSAWITGDSTGLALSDYDITFDRGTVTQELVGETGNMNLAGALSVDGSLTACKLAPGSLGMLLGSIINGTGEYRMMVSGVTGPNGLKMFFKSTQITSFSVDIGDASTITEGSVDFTVLDPHNVSITKKEADGGVWVTD